MKNILVVIAHPRKESLTNAIALEYSKLSKERGNSVEIIDLYRCEHQQPFFTFENANVLTSTKEMEYFQDKITKADEIVLFFPYWWGSMPAILKNFIDWNLSKGFAFEYVKSRPKGLLNGKTMSVFTTIGAPKFIYTLTGANRRLKNMFKEQIINFCGMKLGSFNIYGSVSSSNKNIDKIFNDLKNRI